jgi:hypothetical protein
MPAALMKAVNKFEGYEHVKVTLDVTLRGTGISGTMLRNSLKNDSPEKALAVWSNAFDVNKLGEDWILHLMDITRKGMGIAQQPTPPAVQKPVAERLSNALIRPRKPIAELSSEKLGQYKKAAGAQASAADKAGNTKKADKRFSGIVKATKKQFANDEKGVAEGKDDKIAQLKKDHDTAVHWSKNEKSPQKREAARQKAEKIKRHLETQYKQGVAEGAPIVIAQAPINIRNPKKAPQPYRNQGDIVPDTKPPSTEKRGVKGRPGQRPMPDYNVSERMLPKSAFAGSDKNKLGPAAHAKGKQKGPVKRGQFVGGMEEGVGSKLAGLGLAGAMALGSAGANARVTPGDDPNINRLTGKPNVTQVAPSDVKPAASAGFNKEWLQKAADPNRVGRYMISVEKAQELLNKMNAVDEAKKKGADGKACWKGYRYAGTENGKDKCVPVGEDVENIMGALIENLIRK